jgi:hypothetical protein
MTRLHAPIAAFAAVVVLASCAGPSRTDDDYMHKVANTAQTMQGLIGTVQVALQGAAKNRIPGPYLSVTLAEADDDASATVDTFDSVQPPSETADKLRNKLDKLLQQTTSTMDDLRITVRRGDIPALQGIANPLDNLNQQFGVLAGIA